MTVEVKQRMTEEEAARRFGLMRLIQAAEDEVYEAYGLLANEVEAEARGLSEAARIELAGSSLSNLVALLNAVEKAAGKAKGTANSENAA